MSREECVRIVEIKTGPHSIVAFHCTIKDRIPLKSAKDRRIFLGNMGFMQFRYPCQLGLVHGTSLAREADWDLRMEACGCTREFGLVALHGALENEKSPRVVLAKDEEALHANINMWHVRAVD